MEEKTTEDFPTIAQVRAYFTEHRDEPAGDGFQCPLVLYLRTTGLDHAFVGRGTWTGGDYGVHYLPDWARVFVSLIDELAIRVNGGWSSVMGSDVVAALDLVEGVV